MTKLNIVQEFPTVGVPMWVKRLDDDEAMECVIISREWLRVCVHWDPEFRPRGRTIACTKPINQCVGHKRGLAVRGKAYAHVYNILTKEQQFLELPPKAWKSFCQQVGKPESYRGIRVRVARGKGLKARVKVDIRVQSDQDKQHPLPMELSPLISLCPLWGLKLGEIECEEEADFAKLAS